MADNLCKEIGLEAELSAGVWSNLISDVSARTSIGYKYGIFSNDPLRRAAGAGQLRFKLINSTKNSGGLLGYYSQGNANCRSGWKYGVPVRLWLANPSGDRDGIINGCTMGAAGIGDGTNRAASFDGTNDYIDIYSADLASGFDADAGTIIMHAKVSGSGDWSDSTERTLLYLYADANNYVEIKKTTTANQLQFIYKAGGTTVSISDTSLAADTDWFQISLTWDTAEDELKAYINGAQVGSTQTGLGAWSTAFATERSSSTFVVSGLGSAGGDFVETHGFRDYAIDMFPLMFIGDTGLTGATPWKGSLCHAAIWSTALTAAEIATLWENNTDLFAHTFRVDGIDNLQLYLPLQEAAGASTAVDYSQDTYWKVQGKLTEASPSTGQYGERMVDCAVEDWLYEARQNPIGGEILVQENIRSDEAIQKILDAYSAQPVATDLSAGQETFVYWGDDLKAEKSTPLRALDSIAMSENGYLYLTGSRTAPSVLRFEDRHARVTGSGAAVATFDDTQADMSVSHDLSQIRNRVNGIVYPREIGSSLETLYQSQGDVQIQIGGTQVLNMRYRDPDNRDVRISGKDIVAPLPGTDFEINTDSEGAGSDVTFDLANKIRSTEPDDLIAYYMLDDEADSETVREEQHTDGSFAATAVNSPAFAQTGLGDGRHCLKVLKASSQCVSLPEGEIDSGFDADDGTILIWWKPNGSGDWTDGVEHTLAYIGADANNRVQIYKSSSNNTLTFEYKANGTADSVSKSSVTSTDWMMLALTWDTSADELKAYYNGAQEGSTQTGLGTWAGSLAAAVIGSASAAGTTTPANGYAQHFAIWSKALTGTQISNIYAAMTGGVNTDFIYGGNSTEVTFTNQESTNVYLLSGAKIRGYAIRMYDALELPVNNEASQTAYGIVNEMNYTLRYINDALVAMDFINYTIANMADPDVAWGAERITVYGYRSSAFLGYVLGLEPGAKIAVEETVSGIDDNFFIQGIEGRIEPAGSGEGYAISCNYYLKPASGEQYWALGVEGASEIGETTYLAF